MARRYRAAATRALAPVVGAPSWYTSLPNFGIHTFSGSAWSSSTARATAVAQFNLARPNTLEGGWGADSMWAYSGGFPARNGLTIGGVSRPGHHVCAYGGGHAASNDNRIIAFGSLLDESPQWREWVAPEIPPTRFSGETAGDYGPIAALPDERGVGNRPISSHTYNHLKNVGGNRVIMVGLMAGGIQPSISRAHTSAIDLSSPGGPASPWSVLPELPGGMPQNAAVDSMIGYHSGQNMIYARFGNAGSYFQVARFDCNTDTWSARFNTATGGPGSGCSGEILASRDVMLATNVAGNLVAWRVDATNWNTTRAYTIAQTGPTFPDPRTAPGDGEHADIVADEIAGCFWGWSAADRDAIYRITPPPGVLTESSVWTVERIASPSSTAVVSGRNDVRMYGRMQLVASPTRGLVIAANHSDPVRFMRLP